MTNFLESLARQSLLAFILYTYPTYHPAPVHEVICDKLDEFLDSVKCGKSPRLMLTVPPRHGKLCSDDTDVLTTEGWKKHGELKIGDYVYGANGKPTKVIAIGEPFYATHRVTFTNGAFVDVHYEHEWTLWSRGQRRFRTVETQRIAQTQLWTGPCGHRGGRVMWQLPFIEPIDGVKHELPLAPYALGVWLGDGTSAKPYITMSKDDMAVVKDEFKKLGYMPSAEFMHSKTGVPTVAYSGKDAWHMSAFSSALKTLGLYRNKHIPNEYKTASVQQRLELLAGLIDTDGYVDKSGRVKYSTIFPQLAQDVDELVSSFGIRTSHTLYPAKTSTSGIVGRHDVICIAFNWFDIPTRLKRKRAVKTPQHRRIGIESIEPLAAQKPGRCIQVEATDGLYLVTRKFIPTHNSEIASRRFPAFVLGRYPDMSIISTSYSATLATSFSRDVQRIIDSTQYSAVFPDSRLATPKDSGYTRTAEYFEIVGHRGSYRSSGVGGGITGQGASIIIVDDPVKDRAEADSQTVRESVWNWYTSTLYTRLAPGGGIIVIQTRWHTDDLAGRLLSAQESGDGDKWDVVNFPAIAETDEDFRKRGEALDPARYDLPALLKIKAAIGTRDWEALYQQHPTVDGGAVFKTEWLKFYLPKDAPKQYDAMLASWDMTFKDGDHSDFVVGQVWGRRGGDYYLVDQCRGRWSFTDTLEQFRLLNDKYPQASRKLIEDKANGPAVIDCLKHIVSGIIPIEPDGSKLARAHAVTALFESGNVYIPDPTSAPWVKEYVAELEQFPSGAHDDQVDATTQALREFDRRQPIRIAPQAIRQMIFRRK